MIDLPRDVPWGLQAIDWCFSRCSLTRRCNRMSWHRGGILALTYLAYTCYHMTRKPIAVAKKILSQNCSEIAPPPDIIINDTNRNTWCDWAPFDTPDASALLGTLDSAFLFSYAAAMFLSGFVAERVNLRYFLSLGMLLSAISCYLFGFAKPYNIHSLWYFVLVQALGGVFQSSGWPGVVTVVGNWFGKGKRGLIFGIWNSHTCLGNILGTIIAAEVVQTNWGYSFMVPGVIMGIMGFIIFLFLVPNPEDVGCIKPGSLGVRKLDVANTSDDDNTIDDTEARHTEDERVIYLSAWRQHHIDGDRESLRSETTPMLSVNRHSYSLGEEKPIGFTGALSIPGVVEFALSFFFAKLVSYTFLYWLPLYISSTTHYSARFSANLSTLFDVGGIAGAIAAGLLSDYTGMNAVTCAGMFILTVPSLFLYDWIGNTSVGVNVTLLLIAGILVNGPTALITTAVSAELGTHPSLGSNFKALATVTAIIDGTGSIGAALGPLLAGIISNWTGWRSVFYMLMAADVLALLLLSRMVYKELRSYI